MYRILSHRGVLHCAVLILLFASCKPTDKSDKLVARPNILLAIADDWGYPHAGIYGDTFVSTPVFDRLAAEGALFTNAFCATPSCTGSRAAILTGRYPNQLEAGANLWSFLPKKFDVYTEILSRNGYHTGYLEKGWGPGAGWIEGWPAHPDGYAQNPAGTFYNDFNAFMKERSPEQPFCLWFGSKNPHRPFDPGEGARAGKDPDQVFVPPYLHDSPEVRNDLADYYYNVEKFDRKLGEMVAWLDSAGMLENTLIVITSDNGHPFDRAKANLYDAGTRVPLAIYWKGQIKKVTRSELINLVDLMATFLDAAGIEQNARIPSQSLLPLVLNGQSSDRYDEVFLVREKHYFPNANRAVSELSYPSRALRDRRFLYIRNIRPERWPGILPVNAAHQTRLESWRQLPDTSSAYFEGMAYGRRFGEELYDIQNDPYNLRNLIDEPTCARTASRMRSRLKYWMEQTDDPRLNPDDDSFDFYESFRAR